MLSKMFKAGIIDFLEHVGTPMAVLVGHGGLGRSLADAQVVKVQDKVFFLTAKVGKNFRPLPLSFKKMFRTLLK